MLLQGQVVVESTVSIKHKALLILKKLMMYFMRVKDVRAQNVPTFRFFLNLPRRKVMIYLCQKGKKKGGSPCSFSRS